MPRAPASRVSISFNAWAGYPEEFNSWVRADSFDGDPQGMVKAADERWPPVAVSITHLEEPQAISSEQEGVHILDRRSRGRGLQYLVQTSSRGATWVAGRKVPEALRLKFDANL